MSNESADPSIPMKRQPKTMRTRAITTRVSQQEYTLLLRRANEEHTSISEWARSRLGQTAVGSEIQQVLMAEFWALRFVMINALLLMGDKERGPELRDIIQRLQTSANARKAENGRRLLKGEEPF